MNAPSSPLLFGRSKCRSPTAFQDVRGDEISAAQLCIEAMTSATGQPLR
jgi:hypothetical protein